MRRKKLTYGWVGGVVLAIVILAIVQTLPDDDSSGKHCTDTDGTNPFTVGNTYDWRSGTMFQDRCIDSKTVEEFSCSYPATDLRGKTMTALVTCKHGCYQSMCGTPDLVATDFLISKQPTTSDEFKITYKIFNNGNVPASAVDVDTYFEPCYGILIEPAKSVDPGKSTMATYSVTCKLPGTFKFTNIVDPHDILQESDEANNQRIDVVTVRLP